MFTYIKSVIDWKGKTSLVPLLIGSLLVMVFAGCNDILEVDDTGAIQQQDLTDPEMVDLITNGARSEFQDAYINLSLTSAVFSGEAFVDHTNIGWRNFSLRSFNDDNSINAQLYVNLQQLRASAEDGITRMEEILGEQEVSQNLEAARLKLYAGYSYIYFGENFCSAPVNLSEAYPSSELLQRAITRLGEAITIAEAAQQAGGDAATAEEILNLSNLGIARAHLQLGNNSEAIQFASEVDEGFEAWAYYSNNSNRENNTWAQIANPGADTWISVNNPFQNLNDPRLTHVEEPFSGLNGNDIYPPYQPYNFEGWNPGQADNFIDRATNIRFASGLEAQYIIAEAQGPTGDTEDFVNERRAVGNQSQVSLSGDDLMEELRNQRARDFYMTGRRLADLRRYQDQYGVDLFPTGTYPVGNEVYGDATCYVIPLEEKIGNPNL